MSEEISHSKQPDSKAEVAGASSQEQQRVILEIANRALESGERDPDDVFQVAAKVGEKAHLVDNLRAYASRALFRVKKRPRVDTEQLAEAHHATALSDTSQVEQIEAQILVRELLDTLQETDREIFIRRMNGETCPEIDEAMNLQPRTSEKRASICKNALRRAVKNKLNL